MVAELHERHCCWFDDPEDVNDFAKHVLAELFWGVREHVDLVLGFFEKPWKWDELHGVWALYGAPALDDAGWEGFCEEADRLGLL